MTSQNWYLILKDFFPGFSALITIIVSGFIGLNIWKKQLRYKDEYDIVINFITRIYLLRVAMQNVRQAIVESDKIEESLKAEGLYISYREKRWQEVVNAAVQVDVAKLEVEVRWGNGINELYNPISQNINELYCAIQEHLNIVKDGIKIGKEEYAKILKTMNNESDQYNDDEFTKDLNFNILKIEEYIKSKIKLKVKVKR